VKHQVSRQDKTGKTTVLYILIFTAFRQTESQKILNWMVASISRM
jgi:hypothetical protein